MNENETLKNEGVLNEKNETPPKSIWNWIKSYYAIIGFVVSALCVAIGKGGLSPLITIIIIISIAVIWLLIWLLFDFWKRNHLSPQKFSNELKKINESISQELKQIKESIKLHTCTFEKHDDTVHNTLEDCHTILKHSVEANARINQLCHFLNLHQIARTNGRFHLFFSHRGDAKNRHDRSQASKDSTSIPLAFQESFLTNHLWSVADSFLGPSNVTLYCSCEINTPQLDNPLLKENLVLLGSSKLNRITEFMSTQLNIQNNMHFVFSGNATHSIISSKLHRHPEYKPNPWYPDNELGNPEPAIMDDYALITRTQNPLAPEKYLYIIGGCRAAGAWALHFLFSHYDFMHALNRYSDNQEEGIIEILLKTEYHWGKKGFSDFIQDPTSGKVTFTILYPNKFIEGNAITIDKAVIEDQLKRLTSYD